MNIEKIKESFEDELKSKSNPEKAKQEKRYLKSPFKFYGVPYYELGKLTNNFKKNNEDISKGELLKLCDILWKSEWHELRAIAIGLLKNYPDYIDITTLPFIENLLRTSVNWDQVDEISAHLVGAVIKKDFDNTKNFLVKWSNDKNFWMRRASMLSMILLFRKQNLSFRYLKESKELFFSFAEKMLDESKYSDENFTTEIMPVKMGKFFIRKVIGWVLRDMSSTDPESVVRFVNKNKEKMSGLSYREATRKLSDEYKKQID
ncbi:DNA alkylation repair protein [Candidatus Woesearchaeota archaeon]|nr:DNA alkylation repair protein [Candidatus Woesearchaeota archaeon]